MNTGIIYAIVGEMPGVLYVGSTCCSLYIRWKQHKLMYRNYLSGKSRPLSIHHYFTLHGLETFSIIELATYKVTDKHHLSSYEQLWINKVYNVNKNNPWNVSIVSCKWMRENCKKKVSNCECGLTYTYVNRARHMKSNIHKRLTE